MKHIIISKGTELLKIPVDALMYITSEGNYSTVVTLDGKKRLVSMQLGQIEDIIADQITGSEILVRVGRSLIINMDYVHFIDITKQQLIISNCTNFSAELTASREVLIKLKAYIEALSKRKNE